MKQEVLKIKEKIAPVVEGLGYELVDVKTSVQYGTDTVTVVIFKEGDMGLDDCEKVHNAVDALFDEINPFGDKSYNLEVSSMGLDWPLKTADDFRRRKGQELEISFVPKKSTATKKSRGFWTVSTTTESRLNSPISKRAKTLTSR
ncbi:MAG: hypothetical protein L6V85_06575 [Clostridiales bacterium]|nr:MAG: hypothetical protein L6V85_06575 [Clostridiales bacterium]